MRMTVNATDNECDLDSAVPSRWSGLVERKAISHLHMPLYTIQHGLGGIQQEHFLNPASSTLQLAQHHLSCKAGNLSIRLQKSLIVWQRQSAHLLSLTLWNAAILRHAPC